MSFAERLHYSDSGDEGDISCILMNRHSKLTTYCIWRECRFWNQNSILGSVQAVVLARCGANPDCVTPGERRFIFGMYSMTLITSPPSYVI